MAGAPGPDVFLTDPDFSLRRVPASSRILPPIELNSRSAADLLPAVCDIEEDIWRYVELLCHQFIAARDKLHFDCWNQPILQDRLRFVLMRIDTIFDRLQELIKDLDLVPINAAEINQAYNTDPGMLSNGLNLFHQAFTRMLKIRIFVGEFITELSGSDDERLRALRTDPSFVDLLRCTYCTVLPLFGWVTEVLVKTESAAFPFCFLCDKPMLSMQCPRCVLNKIRPRRPKPARFPEPVAE